MMADNRFSEQLAIAARQLTAEREYWLRELSGITGGYGFPADVTDGVGDFSPGEMFLRLPQSAFGHLSKMSKGSPHALHVVLTAAVAVLLSRYLDVDDVVLGTSIYRQGSGVEKHFSNRCLPLKTAGISSLTVKRLLNGVKAAVKEGMANYRYPIEILTREIFGAAAGNGPSVKLFDVGVLLGNIQEKDDLAFYRPNVLFVFQLEEGGVECRIEYNLRMFSDDFIEGINARFLILLETLFVDLDRRVDEVDIVDDGERRLLLESFNDTDAEFNRDITIHEWLDEMAIRQRDNLAVAGCNEESNLTFSRLKDMSDRLALRLHALGVRRGAVVAIMAEPSSRLVTGILAILKAGAAYMPVDPLFPRSRWSFMMDDSCAGIMLVERRLAAEMGDGDYRTVLLDDESSYADAGIGVSPGNTASQQDLAYVIYTSGTTGKPKGVQLEHKNLVNYATWFIRFAGVNDTDRAMLVSSFAFDLGYTALYPSLLAGGSLHILPRDDYMEPDVLLDYVANHGITYLKMTPSMFNVITGSRLFSARSCAGLRLIVLGGEAIVVKDVEVAHRVCPHIRFMNHYGPTEATIGCIARYIEFDDIEAYRQQPTIGKPIANTRVYILDRRQKLRPTGFPGELYIAGDGLARGYLNRPETTGEKFLEDIVMEGQRVYRTGDLARFSAGGMVEFLGRVDHQVKIRGYRIELGEIEKRLAEYPAVNDSVVAVLGDEPHNKYIAAYVVPEEAALRGSLFEEELTNYLSATLPSYMIPAFFVFMEQLPLNANGKVDRRALPLPRVEAGEDYLAPRDETEEKLVKIWSDILGIDSSVIGTGANFFALGGQSLKATVLAANIQREFSVRIPLTTIFQRPTVASLAENIRSAQNDAYRAVRPVEKKEHYNLSSAQKRLYVLQQMEPKGTVYNRPKVSLLGSGFTVEGLELAAGKLVERHETLRTSFVSVGGIPVQRIHEDVPLAITPFDLSDSPSLEATRVRVGETMRTFVQPFDLSCPPLFRVGLAQLPEGRWALLTDMHHIICDGVSQGVMERDFAALLDGASLAPLEVQYRDFSEWQNAQKADGALAAQEKFWLSQYSESIPALNLPEDFPRPPVQSFAGDVVRFQLDRRQSESIEQLALEHDATYFMVLLALFYVLLGKLSGQEDIAVGIPIAGRSQLELKDIIGMFVNTLVLRGAPNADKPFVSFLREIKAMTVQAFENQDYQFEDLVERVVLERDPSRNPLFDVMFSMLDATDRELRAADGMRDNDGASAIRDSKFDLTLSAGYGGGNFYFIFEYCTRLFESGTIRRFADYFVKIVDVVIQTPRSTLSAVSLLSEDEKRRILDEFNNTDAPLPSLLLAHRLIGRQTESSPDAVAVVQRDCCITYRKLAEDSDRGAVALQEKGAGPDVIVGIGGRRGIGMITGILAILKTGGAYLPLADDLPFERIRYMLSDCGAELLVTAGLEDYSSFVFEGVDTTALELLLRRHDRSFDLDCAGRPSDLAYVIYTSGSTGKAKGVGVHHGGLVNTVCWFNRLYDISVGDRILQATNIAFDVSVEEMFTSLVGGAALIVLQSVAKYGRDEFIALLRIYLPTVAQFVPLVLSEILGHCQKIDSIRALICGGDRLDGELKDRIISLGYNLHNHYGPTEASIDALAAACGPGKVVVGKPVANSRSYIMRGNALQPVGLPGELCIAGENVASGYLNNPEGTFAAFGQDPFRGGERMYRTGDLARYMPDGNIEFLGRIDSQVKIRGFRIELGEIESALLSHPQVSEAVVIDRKDSGGGKYLAAYIVPRERHTVDDNSLAEAVKETLAKRLPAYMVPAHFMVLDHIPLTPNGKADRKALPEPILEHDILAASKNETERALVCIWAEVLGIDPSRIGVETSFFHLGGHSLRATVLVSLIQRDLRVLMTLTDVFRFPTVRGQASHINSLAQEAYKEIRPSEKRDYYPLSSAQKRLYVLQRMDAASTVYNLRHVTLLRGIPNLQELRLVFEQLLRRHESFRTSFVTVGDEPVQRVSDSVELTVREMKKIDDPVAGLPGLLNRFIIPFDLSRPPLLRLGVAPVGEDSYFLLVDMHHIVSDGSSMEVLVREFHVLLERGQLPRQSIQYKDYALWQGSEAAAGNFEQQKQFWLREFAGEIPVLQLPYDYDRPAVQKFSGEALGFYLDSRQSGMLRSLAEARGATLYMALLSVFDVLLSKLGNLEDVVVGTPVAGRRHADLENVIGMFVNTLAIRTFPVAGTTFTDFLMQVREKTLAAFENQDFQFEELVDSLDIVRDPGRNPLFDIMFVLQNTGAARFPENEGKDLPGDWLEVRSLGGRVARFDITWTAFERGECLFFGIEYCTALFTEHSIRRFIDYFRRIVDAVTGDPAIHLKAIDMLTPAERSVILETFNDTGADFPVDVTVVDLLEGHLARRPDRVAAVFQDGHLTYKGLLGVADVLAAELRARGICNEDIVGITSHPSLHMAVGIVGVLRSGAAFLPMDPAYPDQRAHFMLADSGAGVVCCQRELAGRFDGAFDTVILDEVVANHEAAAGSLPGTAPLDLAYIIYTSGSTGTPKGVLIEHRSLMNMVTWHKRAYGVTEHDRASKLAGFGFDATVLEMFPFLACGASLFIVPAADISVLSRLNRFFSRYCITISFLPTQLCEQYMKEYDNCSLRVVLTGGDRLRDFTPRSFVLVNNYGPTENTVVSTFLAVDGERPSFPIGSPVANTRAYILGPGNTVQPLGVAGELCLAGTQLARGYLNRPSLTAEKFVPDPFHAGEFMYRSGDLARWLPDGAIEFLGRIDQQVKIRGLRIELGEIENRLMQLPEVKNAVVAARENATHETYLCAYVAPGEEFDQETVIAALGRLLPDYMIPAYFVEVDAIPLTPNGKVDLRALPEPELDLGSVIVPPADSVEAALVSIWEELLSLQPGSVSTNADFFRLGGHSLRATILVGRIHRELGIEIPLTEIFRSPTIQGLANFIRAAGRKSFFSIQPAEKKDYYLLSSAQKRLFILQRMDRGSTVYNIPLFTRIQSGASADRVESVFRQLIGRHESFRTSFVTVNEEPVQRVHGQVDFALQRFDAAKDPETVASRFVRPFALDQPPLLRAGLFDGGEDGDVLMVDMHHIISDGASMDVLVREFHLLMADCLPLPCEIQYKDYAEWMKSDRQRERILEQEAFWKKEFGDDVPVLQLPCDFPRPVVQSFEGGSMGFGLSRELTEELTRLASGQGLTPFMLLLGIFGLLMAKLGNQPAVVVGTPVAGRRHADLEGIIGMFVNTLAIRMSPAFHKTFPDFIQEVKRASLQAFENQDYPFEELVERVALERDAGRNPLFDVMFAYQTIEAPIPRPRPTANEEAGDAEIREYGSKVSRFDMTWTAQLQGNRVRIGIEYCSRLFEKTTIRRFIHYFRELVGAIVSTPGGFLYELDILPGDERKIILETFNDTACDFPYEATIHNYLNLHRESQPDRIAVVFKDRMVTYGGYMERAGHLAMSLRERGASNGTIVGIVTEPCAEMMMGIAGILLAGAAFLPIDHNYPDSRIAFMLKDSGSVTTLCQRSMEGRLPLGTDPVILEDSANYEGNGDIQDIRHHPLDLAYIIYTSGSTGKPKGVMIGHRSLINMATWHNRLFSVTAEDRASKYAGFSFDASIYETFPCLVSGGLVDVVPAEIKLDLNRLHRFFIRHCITIVFLPTQLCEQYMHGFENPCLKTLHAGGEQMREFTSRSYMVVNNYGPSENTVVSTMHIVRRDDAMIPIGPPVANTQSYILNESLRPQPIGVPGELCLSGVQLARGYLNRPELTEEKFVLHPFKSGERMYRTGDLARFLPDGTIEFLGRIDFQIKIRGMRVELGEIESHVLSLPTVANAVVLARENPSKEKSICAYVVADGVFDQDTARAHLARHLPDYMIPAHFVVLDEIPLTANGKVDRRALPEPRVEFAARYLPPACQLEERLAHIWAELLAVDAMSIGMDADFFKLGGHSLRATIMAGRVHREAGVEIPLSQIFRNPTIRGLANFILEANQIEFEAIDLVEKRDYYAVTSAQRRLYAVQQADLNSVAYNIPNVIRVPDSIDGSRLQSAFRALVQRHESFRTSFTIVAGEPVQRIQDDLDFSIEEGDVSLDRLPMAIEAFVRPFELSLAPLLRVGLVRAQNGQCRLMVDMHHIISDGSSMEVLVHDFMALYNGESLPAPRIQYKDYAGWINREDLAGKIRAQESFWLQEFSGFVPELELPLDFPRPTVQSYAGKTLVFHLGKTVTDGLNRIATEENATLFMALVAVLNVVLSKLAGVRDVVIGTPLAGRRHPDLEHIIGMFINTVALRNFPRPELAFIEFFRDVKERTLRAFENQEYPFESLVDRLGIKRDRSRNPLFDVVLALQNIDRPAAVTPAGQPAQRDGNPSTNEGEFQIATAKFDITILVSQEAEGLSVAFQYRSLLFNEETIERFFGYFSEVAEAVIERRDVPLAEIDVSHGLVVVDEAMPEAEFDF